MKKFKLPLFWLALLALAASPAGAQQYTTSPGLAIPPVGTGGQTPCFPGIDETVSVLNVPDSIVITDTNVLLRITHTFTGDLDIRLSHPDGTTIQLADNRGGGGDNFGNNALAQNTIFDQQAALPISAGVAPFIGNFRPDGNLNNFNGKNAQGNWTLRVCDQLSLDVGTLHFWGLVFNTVAPVSHVVPGLFGHHPNHRHHREHGAHMNSDYGDPPHIPGHSPALTADPGGTEPPPAMLAARNEDGSLNANSRMLSRNLGQTSRPAAHGSIIQMFGPAAGLTLVDENGMAIEGDPSLITAPAEGGRLYRTRSLPVVRIAGIEAEVLFSGLAPGLTGTWQINVRIPEGAPSGVDVPAQISYEGRDLLRKVAIAIQ
jgi:subtilisin-like proprotein convertase family protein